MHSANLFFRAGDVAGAGNQIALARVIGVKVLTHEGHSVITVRDTAHMEVVSAHFKRPLFRRSIATRM